MTIEELVKILRTFPPNETVIVKGYEGGFNDISIVKPQMIDLNVHKEWYYGLHEESEGQKGITAVLIGGENPNKDF